MTGALKRWKRTGLIAILAGLAIYSLIYIVRTSLSPLGGIDFHSYWYSGHFLRQGDDPYQAYLNQQIPRTPLRYIDLPDPFAGDVAQPGLANVPANTAPMVLLLGFFAFFSWPTAKLLWLLCNLLFLLLLPRLLEGWLSPEKRFKPSELLLIGLLVFSLFGTRNSAVNGQTSIFVYLLMLASLVIADKSPWASGIALGFALSKYSLSLPVMLLFIIERRWKSIATSATVQIAGLLAVSAISGQSPMAILSAYKEIMLIHTSMPGIHLANLFAPGSLTGSTAPILLSVGVFSALLAAGLRKTPSGFSINADFYTQNNRLVFDILLLWTLLVAYHRAYDSFIVLSVLVNAWRCLRPPAQNEHAVVWRRLGIAGVLISTGVLILPASGLHNLLGTLGSITPGAWLQMHNALITWLLLGLLTTASIALIDISRDRRRW